MGVNVYLSCEPYLPAGSRLSQSILQHLGNLAQRWRERRTESESQRMHRSRRKVGKMRARVIVRAFYYINLFDMPFNLHRCTALYLLATSETESNWPCQPGGGKRGRNIPEWIFDSLLPHSLYHNTQKTPVKFVEEKLSLYCYTTLTVYLKAR